jgi:hypothetical protein
MNVMTDFMQHEMLGVDWTVINSTGHTFRDVALVSQKPEAWRMKRLCDAWMKRCADYTRYELNQVIQVKQLPDIVLSYMYCDERLPAE